MSEQSSTEPVHSHPCVDAAPFAAYLSDVKGDVEHTAGAQLTEYAFRCAIEDAVRAGIAACDLDGRQTYVNACFCGMVGWSEAELVGARPPFRYWPAEQRDAIETSFREMLAGETPSSGFEMQFCCSDGRRIDVLIEAAPLVSGDGSLQGWLASITNITDRKRMEAALQASEQELQALQETTRVATWEWDLTTNDVHWSDNMEALHGMPAGSLGADIASFLSDVHPSHRERLQKVILAALESGSAYRIEYPVAPKHGRLIWMQGRGRVIRDHEGRPVKVTGMCMDVTERKAAQAELRRLQRDVESGARELNAAKRRLRMLTETLGTQHCASP